MTCSNLIVIWSLNLSSQTLQNNTFVIDQWLKIENLKSSFPKGMITEQAASHVCSRHLQNVQCQNHAKGYKCPQVILTHAYGGYQYCQYLPHTFSEGPHSFLLSFESTLPCQADAVVHLHGQFALYSWQQCQPRNIATGPGTDAAAMGAVVGGHQFQDPAGHLMTPCIRLARVYTCCYEAACINTTKDIASSHCPHFLINSFMLLINYYMHE